MFAKESHRPFNPIFGSRNLVVSHTNTAPLRALTDTSVVGSYCWGGWKKTGLKLVTRLEDAAIYQKSSEMQFYLVISGVLGIPEYKMHTWNLKRKRIVNTKAALFYKPQVSTFNMEYLHKNIFVIFNLNKCFSFKKCLWHVWLHSILPEKALFTHFIFSSLFKLQGSKGMKKRSSL